MTGKLTGPDFVAAIMELGPTPAQVQFVLSEVARSEPNAAWVRSKEVRVVNGQIVVSPNALKPDAPGIAPGINAPNPLPNALSKLTGINAIGDFFTRLEDPHTWTRIGEFIGGAILLIVALNALTRGPVRSATTGTVKSGVSTGVKVARTVAK